MRVKDKDEVVDGQLRDEGLNGARDGGEVDVQPDQGRTVDKRATCSENREELQFFSIF
jgi:hypothetical protein